VIEFFEIPIGEGGVLACTRCAAHQGPRADWPLDRIAKQLDSAAKVETDTSRNVSFMGFEPFRHPELPQLISAAVESGFDRIRLQTDAGALAQASNAAGAIGTGVRQLEVVVLGDAATHDALAQRPGHFELARAGVEAFRSVAEREGVHIWVSAIIPACRHNIAVLPAAVAAAAHMGAQAVVIDASGFRVKADAEALLDAALQTGTVNRVAVSVRGWAGSSRDSYGQAPFEVREVRS